MDGMDLETQTQTEQTQTVTIEMTVDEAFDMQWALAKESFAATKRARDARNNRDHEGRQDALADRDYFRGLADRINDAAKAAERGEN